MTKHSIYLASSWRNAYQPALLRRLRDEGHEVYDFRNPREGDHGFQWSEVDPEWQEWTARQYRLSLQHPLAESGFRSDMEALHWAEVVVLLLPSGRSAHSEAAWACGQGKPVIVHIPEPCEPELMYKMFAAITCDDQELVEVLWPDVNQLRQLSLSRSVEQNSSQRSQP